MSHQTGSPRGDLTSRAWRTRHSAWLLAVILGFGLLSFVGFLYCAVRVGSRVWWRRAAVTFAATVPGWVVMSLFSSTDEQRADMLRMVPEDYPIILWIVLTGYAFVVNRDYLRWRAGSVEPARAPDGQAQLLAPPPEAPAGPPASGQVPPAQPSGGRIIDL